MLCKWYAMTTQEDKDVNGTNSRDSASEVPALDVPIAMKKVWYMWLIALLSAVTAIYFATNRDIMSSPAEPFYAIIFGIIAVISAVYGIYIVRDLTTPF